MATRSVSNFQHVRLASVSRDAQFCSAPRALNNGGACRRFFRVAGDLAKQTRERRARWLCQSAPDLSEHTLNVNLAVDKEHETLSFTEIATLPIDALQGIAERGADALKKIGVKTVADLANLKYYKWAKAISTLADKEEEGKRSADAAMHANSAVVKEFELKSFKEMADAPVWALQGISPRMAEDLSAVQIRSVRDFAESKYAAWSEAIVTLAALENK
ncbi:hypothetical protein BSKO_13825 [Bryopsis sp. KO-2023]|nr:hypothetical protein BSKO_13825 [Bryopsis sp. KO-2023]